MPSLLEAVTDPTDFSSKALRTLDSTLRCGMCKEFFQGPVLLSQCGHTFCSICIRGYLPSKAECPACRHPTSESHLVRNITLEDAVFAYEASRLEILDALRYNEEARRKAAEMTDLPPPRKKAKLDQPSISSRHKNGPSSLRLPAYGQREADYTVISDEDMEVEDDQAQANLLSRRSASRVASPSFQRKKPQVSLSDPNSPSKSSNTSRDPIVPCPVCSSELPLSKIDLHIERGCTKENKRTKGWNIIFTGGGKERNASSKGKARAADNNDDLVPTERLPKVTWSLIKDKAIRGLLSEHSLSSDGDKSTMTARYDHWIALYNSNIDTSRPKSLAKLRKELVEWERAKDRDGKAKKEREKKVADSAAYVESHKSDFADLIKKARLPSKVTAAVTGSD